MELHRTRLMGRSLVSVLGLVPTAQDRLRFLAAYADLTGRAALGRPAREHRVRVRFGDDVRTWHLRDVGEMWALAEVLVADHYSGSRLPDDARVVVDVGANIGAATAWFRARYPDAHIVAVEPDPRTYALLERNVGGDERVHLVRAAISDHDGEMFLTDEGMSVLTRVQDDAPADGRGTRVECLSLASLLARTGVGTSIDLLKIDAEGGEWRILEGSLADVGTVVMEVHEFDGGPSADERLAEVAEREQMRVEVPGSGRDIRWLTRPAT